MHSPAEEGEADETSVIEGPKRDRGVVAVADKMTVKAFFIHRDVDLVITEGIQEAVEKNAFRDAFEC